MNGSFHLFIRGRGEKIEKIHSIFSNQFMLALIVIIHQGSTCASHLVFFISLEILSLFLVCFDDGGSIYCPIYYWKFSIYVSLDFSIDNFTVILCLTVFNVAKRFSDCCEKGRIRKATKMKAIYFSSRRFVKIVVFTIQ